MMIEIQVLFVVLLGRRIRRFDRCLNILCENTNNIRISKFTMRTIRTQYIYIGSIYIKTETKREQ